MSIFEMLFGDSKAYSNNRKVMDWAIGIILDIERTGLAANIFKCMVRFTTENDVQIVLQDWYEGFVPKFAKEHDLEKNFNLQPISGYEDLYSSRLTPRVTGNTKQFMRDLLREINGKYDLGYRYNPKFNLIEKEYR